MNTKMFLFFPSFNEITPNRHQMRVKSNTEQSPFMPASIVVVVATVFEVDPKYSIVKADIYTLLMASPKAFTTNETFDE